MEFKRYCLKWLCVFIWITWKNIINYKIHYNIQQCKFDLCSFVSACYVLLSDWTGWPSSICIQEGFDLNLGWSFCGFPQSQQGNAKTIPQLGQDCLLPNPFHLLSIYHPTSYSMLHSLQYWKCCQINHTKKVCLWRLTTSGWRSFNKWQILQM
jgi:hypothetical protein